MQQLQDREAQSSPTIVSLVGHSVTPTGERGGGRGGCVCGVHSTEGLVLWLPGLCTMMASAGRSNAQVSPGHSGR